MNKRKMLLALCAIWFLCLATPGWGQRKEAILISSATGVVTGIPIDLSTIVPFRHTVQIVVTGSPTGCTFSLEGSLDDGPQPSNWFDLSGSQTCTSNVVFHVANKPIKWVRGNLSALSGGTSPTATVRYLGTH